MSKLKSRDMDLDHQQGGGITQLEQKWALSDNQNSSQLHHYYYQSIYCSFPTYFNSWVDLQSQSAQNWRTC